MADHGEFSLFGIYLANICLEQRDFKNLIQERAIDGYYFLYFIDLSDLIYFISDKVKIDNRILLFLRWEFMESQEIRPVCFLFQRLCCLP